MRHRPPRRPLLRADRDQPAASSRPRGSTATGSSSPGTPSSTRRSRMLPGRRRARPRLLDRYGLERRRLRARRPSTGPRTSTTPTVLRVDPRRARHLPAAGAAPAPSPHRDPARDAGLLGTTRPGPGRRADRVPRLPRPRGRVRVPRLRLGRRPGGGEHREAAGARRPRAPPSGPRCSAPSPSSSRPARAIGERGREWMATCVPAPRAAGRVPTPYGDGHAGERTAAAIADPGGCSESESRTVARRPSAIDATTGATPVPIAWIRSPRSVPDSRLPTRRLDRRRAAPDRRPTGTRSLALEAARVLHLRHPRRRARRRRRGLRVPHVARQLPHRALRPLRASCTSTPARCASELATHLSGPLPRVRLHRGAVRVRLPGPPPARGAAACSPAAGDAARRRRDPRRRVRRRLPPRPAARVRSAGLAARGRGPRRAGRRRGRGPRPRSCTAARSRSSTSCPSRYDFALLIQTIEHVGDPAAVLRAIRRVLRPGRAAPRRHRQHRLARLLDRQAPPLGRLPLPPPLVPVRRARRCACSPRAPASRSTSSTRWSAR